MTEQQKRFAEEYLKCNNGTKAAIIAGYSEHTARQQASQLLNLEEVESYLDERRKSISEKSLVDAAWVQIQLKTLAERCMQAEPVLEKIDGEWVPTGEYKFDSSGANKAIENLGKIVGVFEKDNKQKPASQPPVINIINPNGK